MPSQTKTAPTAIIFLDADTIINTDIEELWREELGDSPLGAVPDANLLTHYGRKVEPLPSAEYIYQEGVTVEDVFNAGVLLIPKIPLVRRADPSPTALG